MLGFIRDEDMAQAEEEFPGISALYLGCVEAPRTFLDLVARYLGLVAAAPAPGDAASHCSPPAPQRARGRCRTRTPPRRVRVR